ncbi:DUF445 domain-containing protein [Caryophanon tenue]|uniref:DUF445 domain-containing protein n=1 Tax=Caryophanon tenue TaxID=33978 RepID=A0A1C0YIM8_9BACL|nr:DUF445 family protein [Caryophanon tenue]OCS87036.1 hypothetical protein A6M13_11780 [Caryophanon tenue]
MDAFMTILFMVVVGSVIAGSTNHLAIKMLFHPYEAKYIGKWRVPFTPGLIPKRREDLAIQLGLTVSNYLLTPDMFRDKILSPEVRTMVGDFARTKVEETVFRDDRTLAEWLKVAGFEHLPRTIEGKVDEVIATQFKSVQNTLATKTVRELLPADFEATIDKKVPELITYLIEKGETYFKSYEGQVTIQNMLDDFLNSKGSLGNMVQMFLGGDTSTLAEKIQRELLMFLRSDGLYDILYNLVQTEYDKLKDRPVTDFTADIDFNRIEETVKTYAKKEMNLDERLNYSIHHYWPQGKAWATEDLLPKMLDRGFVTAENKIEDVVKKLNLQEVVRQQVDTFPVQKLEELILGISKREFKMITALGFLLGGIIGLIQGLFVVFVG